MNKEKFLSELREKLFGLPLDEIAERLEFYNEIISDRIEDGLTEEQAIQELGSVDSIVQQIMSEIPLSTIVKEKVKPKRKLKNWEIALLIVSAPIWIPLFISAVSAVLSLYFAVWMIVVSIYLLNLSLGVGGVAGLIGIFVYLGVGNLSGALFSSGIGIASVGLAILLFFACVGITKAVIKATETILLGIKISFIHKEESL